MKNLFARLALVAALGSLLTSIQPAFAQGTAFTYQGQLSASGSPAGGNYDFTFTLFNTNNTNSGQVGNTLTNLDVGVTNGLFTVTLDYGAVFTGNATWLSICVRTNGGANFTALIPLQELTPTPYAIYAPNAGNAATATTAGTASSVAAINITGTVLLAQLPAAVVTNTETGVTLSGTFNGNGGGLTNLTVSGAQVSSVGNVNGANNFFVGPAGNATMSGSDNTASGALALYRNTNGSFNTADGIHAISENLSGSFNTAVGSFALEQLGGYNNAGGSNNIALGYDAGYSFLGNESSNIDIGNVGATGENNVTRIGSSQTAAYIAGVINGNGGGLTNLNVSASQLTCFNGGLGNFFVGPSGNSTVNGNNNTGNGYEALFSITSGNNNTADGFAALYYNTSSSGNTANGSGALFRNASGNNNTADGYNALNQLGQNNGAGGSNNIALGYNAGSNFTGSESSNIDIGNVGVQGENNTIRIGDPAVQTSTYIAGVINGNGAGLTSLNPVNLSAGNVANAVNFTQSVGIGNTSPSFQLHVKSASSDCQIGLQSPDTGNHLWTMQSSGGGSYIGTFQIIDRTAGVSRFYIDTSGHIGLGVTSITSGHFMDTTPGAYLTTGGAWTSSSDRNVKEDFKSIRPVDVLAKVAAMPITQWKYKVEPDGVMHLGPVAQDFHAAFGLNGADDRHITDVDEGGVALAAIQGLNQKLDEKDAEIQDLKQSVAELKQMVQTLAEKK